MTSKGLARPSGNPTGLKDMVRETIEQAVARGLDTTQIAARFGFTLSQVRFVEERMERLAWEISAL